MDLHHPCSPRNISIFTEVTNMTNESASDDKKLGHKRAPGNGQFKPGVSGNPGGRPKGARNLRTELKEVMDEKVVIRKNGKARRVRSLTAILMRLRQKAIDGDTKAIVKVIDTEITLNPAASSDDPAEETLSATDKEIIANFLRDAAPDQVADQILATQSAEPDSPVAGDLPSAVPGAGAPRDLDSLISAEHPLRRLRLLANSAITALDAEFASYATSTRAPISPDKLLRARLLRMFYTIPTDELLLEELDYSPVYRWFVGLRADEPAWALPEFTQTLDSLLKDEVISKFWRTFLTNAEVRAFLLSDAASFSFLSQFAKWHGYIQQREDAANEADNEERNDD
jgi:hypothetical protein